MKPRVARGLLALASAFAATCSVQAAEDAMPRLIESPQPRYPGEAFYLGITGTVVLIMDVSGDGAVKEVFVEQTSRNRMLDKAAIDTAKTWRFAPALVDGVPVSGRVRVPVSFALEPDAVEDDAIRGLAFALPPRLQVPASPVLHEADGTVAGYIEDPISLEFGSVADAIALLKARGTQRSAVGLSSDVAIYTLDDENGRTRWLVYEGGHYYAPSLVRKRLTHDGRRAYLVTRMLCEAKAPNVCTRLAGTVQRPYRQRAVPLNATTADAP